AYDTENNLVSVTRGIAGTNPHQVTTGYIYDSYNNLTNQVIGLSGSVQERTTISYDKAFNVVAILDAVGNTTSMGYDQAYRLTRVDEAYGSPVQRSSTMLYDAVGNVISETTGIATNNPHVATTSFIYDALDRPTQIIEAYGVSGLQRTTTTVYDRDGRVLQVVNPVGTITSIAYDALSRTVQVDEAYGTSVQRSSTMIYDATDNLLSRTIGIAASNPQVLTTSFAYDALNRATQQIDAFGLSLQRTTTIIYDAVYNVVNVIDPM